LPERAMLECLIGLVESQTIDRDRAFRNFEEWVFAKFGAGVSKHFMIPYNEKGWSTPLSQMGFYWIAERVAVVDWKKALETALLPKNVDWGPNATFGYPATRGTVGLWLAVLPYLGDRVRYLKRAVCVDEDEREIRFSDGSTARYEKLLTTLPLEAFVTRLARAPESVRAASKKLLFNRLFSVGVGLERPSPSTKNWIYFPNPKTPFYRMTYLSNYSPDIVPGGDTTRHCSLLMETTYSRFRPLPSGDFVEAVIEGLVSEGILEHSDLPLIESRYLIHAGHAYPIPSVDGNGALATPLHTLFQQPGSRGQLANTLHALENGKRRPLGSASRNLLSNSDGKRMA